VNATFALKAVRMPSMNRPKGLLLTAWIMVFLNTTAWILQYWPHRAHYVDLHTSTAVFVGLLMFTIRVCAFVCIFYYAQGRNWARILVLVTSAGMLLTSLLLKNKAALSTPSKISSAAWAILSIFFLYWLNTRPVKEFFKRGMVTGEAS
jgi:hypothetical protein